MGNHLQDKINAMPAKRRKKIIARAEELIQEVHTLREVRSLRNKTQAQVAVLLQKRQEEISRLERRDDFLLSTLSEYIDALGGRLKVIAEFEDSPSIVLHTRCSKSLGTKTNSPGK